MQVSHQDRTLLETLTFIAPGLGTTTVVLGQAPESLTFLLEFEKMPDKQQNLAFAPVDKHTLKLTFTNWDNVLGIGLLNPFEVGTFQKRRLYLFLFVRQIGSEGDQKLVTLSFYKGEEVPDGHD